MAESFYVTTPIYYVNARPHIGHAYTTIVADVLARRNRLLGKPTWFLTGTDEHGQKIERSAAAAGVPPQQFADDVSQSFHALWQRMGITNDQWIRTTDPAHALGVQKLFRTLYQRGDIYLSGYTGQYCVSEEMFVEGPPGTIGPDGRPTETVTEENFFFRLSRYQLQLLDLIESSELSITPETRRNEVLSFLRGDPARQSQRTAAGTPYEPGALKDLSVSRSSFTWGIPVPEDVQQSAGATKQHVVYVWLDALANYITALGYGSDDESRMDTFWPADVHLVGKEIIRFHCVYWPAFLLAAGLPLPKAVTAHGWLLFDDAKMSKSKGNIVRTETILDAFGKLCPPQPNDAALADDLVTREGMEPFREPTQHERDLFASDVLRYFLLREIPFGQDGSFTFDALVTRYNADLANGYGNLVSRVLKMIATYFDQKIPSCYVTPSDYKEPLLPHDVMERATRYVIGTNSAMGNAALIEDLTKQASYLIRECDEALSRSAPWKIRESGTETHENRSLILNTAAESIRIITALLYPILPFAVANIWRQLGLGSIREAAERGDLRNLQWGGLKPGTKLGLLGPVFPRAEKGLAQTMSDMEQSKHIPQVTEQGDAAMPSRSEFTETPVSSAAQKDIGKPRPSKLVDETFAARPSPADSFDPAAPPRTSALPEANPGAQVAGSMASTTERPGTPPHTEAGSGIFGAQSAAATQPAATDSSPEIGIEDFAKVELRVGKVLVCERIPKADKLLRLEVDLGHEQRQILSGIAEWYTPEDLLGRRIVVITNLAPRKMRGLVSHGMLLAASAEGGKPALATFAESDDLPLGARLK